MGTKAPTAPSTQGATHGSKGRGKGKGDGEGQAQAYWVDPQGNVYFATGFAPRDRKARAQDGVAPMMVPSTHNPYATTYQQGGYPQGWVVPQVYCDPHYYNGDSGAMSHYGHAGGDHYPHVGTPFNYADGPRSPAQSPVNSPGQSHEMAQASFGQHSDLMLTMMQHPQTNWENVRQHVVTLARTRNGSVMLQWHLEHGSPEVFAEILDMVLGSIGTLICDRYGSHIMRRLVERCDPAQRLLVWGNIKDKLAKVACTRYGTWTVQALLDATTLENGTEPLAALKKALSEENVVKLMKDQHGGHTIAACVQKLDEHGLFVFEAAAKNLGTLCNHKYGCTTLQRMLESANEAASVLMAREVSKVGLSIVNDQYGNYIVQHVLGLELPSCLESRGKLFDSLRGHFFNLSTHKFGSNIVEKCLKMGDRERSAVITELTQIRNDSDSDNDSNAESSSSLEHLIVHAYGNYVAQSALILCSDEELELFRSRLEAFAAASDRECEAKIAAAQQSLGPTNGSDSSAQPVANLAQPFRKTVHGRKILQKLHMRTGKDRDRDGSPKDTSGESDGSTGDTVGAGGPVKVSVVDFKVGGSSDAQGSRPSAAGANHNGSHLKRGHLRGRSRGRNDQRNQRHR